MDCQVELAGVEETLLRLEPETPLVGFHGMATEDGITSLGLILLDTMTPGCLLAREPEWGSWIDESSEFDIDEAVENSITREE